MLISVIRNIRERDFRYFCKFSVRNLADAARNRVGILRTKLYYHLFGKPELILPCGHWNGLVCGMDGSFQNIYRNKCINRAVFLGRNLYTRGPRRLAQDTAGSVNFGNLRVFRGENDIFVPRVIRCDRSVYCRP